MEQPKRPGSSVAERNRRAKMKFLAGMKNYYEDKRKTSMESLNSIGSSSRMSERKLDLSVPGTPVSSRYLESLSRAESDVEDEVEKPAEVPNEIVISSLVIDRFLKDMKALGMEEEEQFAEVVHVEDDKVDGEGEVTEEYFRESEQKQAYHRSFSQAAQTLHTTEVKSPAVKRYFEESSAKQSYSREFSEAFNELDPKTLQSDPLKDETKTVTKGYKSSVPGTPINSKQLHKLKQKNYISDSSDDEADGPSDSLADPLNRFIKDMEQLKLLKDTNMAKIEKQPLVDFSVSDYLESSKEANTYSRSFSQAAQTLHSSQVKSPAVKDYFDKSDEKKTFRRQFSEVYQEMSAKESSPTKTEVQQIEPLQLRAVVQTNPAPKQEETVDALLGTFEPPKQEKRIFESDFSAESYLTSSDAKKSYARTFSEAAQTLHTSDVKNPAVREYFDKSEEKRSFRREFSEVYREVESIEQFARDVVSEKHAATKTLPSSSDQKEQKQGLDKNEQSDQQCPTARSTDEDGSSEGTQVKRSISVPGTPVNSRKLYPKQRQQSFAEQSPSSNVKSTYAKTDIPLTPRLHPRKQHVEQYFAAGLFRRQRSFTRDPEKATTNVDDKLFYLADDAAEASGSTAVAASAPVATSDDQDSTKAKNAALATDQEFWKSFGASTI